MTRLATYRIVLGLCLIGTAMQAQEYEYLGSFNGIGVPDYLSESDQVSNELLSLIEISLPEREAVPDHHPEYIAEEVETDLLLSDSADVYVTFVWEGAGWRNVLGFYTYNIFNPPTSKPDIEDITIIFPNVSEIGSGGGLVIGNKVKIGTYPPNTGIGWVLISNGWDGQQVGDGYYTLFSEYSFNPEADPSLQHHNVLLYEPIDSIVVMGFEDIRRDESNCDQDFNDAVFYVSATPNSAVITEGYNFITPSTPEVSTANQGGLESLPGLSEGVARDLYQRQISPYVDYEIPDPQRAYHREETLLVERPQLNNFIPNLESAEVEAFTSTPEFLPAITNAESVLGVDYFRGAERKAAILATETYGRVYDHSKLVCDRLKGGTIQSVRKVIIDEQEFILTAILRREGYIEYVLQFSAYWINPDLLGIYKYWNPSDYPEENHYYNFQVWAVTPQLAIYAVEEILANMQDYQALFWNGEPPETPQVYLRSGYYRDGRLQMVLVNTEGAASVRIYGSQATHETEERIGFDRIIPLDPEEYLVVLDLSTDLQYDFQLTIQNPDDDQRDDIYLADGAWGLINREPNTVTTEKSAYQLERGALFDGQLLERGFRVQGTTTENVTVFRMLEPAFQVQNLSDYETLSFSAKGAGKVEVILLKESIHQLDQQYRTVVELTPTGQTYHLPWSAFAGLEQDSSFLQDLKGILFQIPACSGHDHFFELEVWDLGFGRYAEDLATYEGYETAARIFPNPTTTTSQLEFELPESGLVLLEVFDATGRLFWQQERNLERGIHRICLPYLELATTFHLVRVQGAGGLDQRIRWLRINNR